MRAVRTGLSLFLVFHLFSVLLVPNSDNYTGSVFMKYLTPYLQFFELTNNWNFFSPNPEPPVYVDYQLLDSQGEPYKTARWPEVKSPFMLQERQMRRITAADFMVNSEIAAEKMMVNYLCHQSPVPHAVRIWRVMQSVPRLDDVATGKRSPGDGLGEDRKFVSHTFCELTGVGV